MCSPEGIRFSHGPKCQDLSFHWQDEVKDTVMDECKERAWECCHVAGQGFVRAPFSSEVGQEFLTSGPSNTKC